MTLEVDFSGEDRKQLVEKVLVRLDEAETVFNSQGACVVVSQDKDCQHIITVLNKSLCLKEQSMLDVFSRGKSFYIHYPVYPSITYRLTPAPEKQEDPAKLEVDDIQLYEQLDDITRNDFGTLYLGGNFSNLHSKQESPATRPYKDHLDLK
jgi:hypothetical protein